MSKKLKLPFFFVLIFLLLALGLSPVFAEDVFWSTPEKINTSSNNAILPTIVTGPNGYLHSAWMELNTSGPGSSFWDGELNPGILYSYWNGDAWSDPYPVSEDSTSWTGFPGIAVTSNNYIHVVWEDDSEVVPGVWARILYRFYDGNSWSTPECISQDVANTWAYSPKIVTDAADNLHVIYNLEDYSNFDGARLYYTKYNGSDWSTPEELTIKTGMKNLQHSAIDVDSSNYPHVILWEMGEGSWDTERGIYHTNYNGASWETPVKLSTDGQYPKIVIDDNDYRHVIWVVWYTDQVGGTKNRVEYKRWDGSWSASPTIISSDATYSDWMLPIIGISSDSNNNVYVGWGEKVGWDGNPTKGIQTSYKKWNGTTWSSTMFMRLTYNLDTPFLYRDIWDNQHLTWSEENESTGAWEFWYSTVPVNVQSYNPASAFSMTLNVTGDTLTIPSGALAQTTNISAQIGPLPASYDPQYTTLPRSYTYRPHGTDFLGDAVATATIEYTDGEVIGSDEKNMVVYIWDSQLNDWTTSFTTSVNTGKNTLTAELPHFSLFGIMAPKVKANWLPPISKAETYELKEGSTLPVKFTLNHFDNNPLSAPELPEDVVVVIKKDGGEVVGGRYEYGESSDDVRYDPDTGQFIVNIHTRELNLELGTYSVEVLIFGQAEATEATRTQFEILEKGKVKGTSSE